MHANELSVAYIIKLLKFLDNTILIYNEEGLF